MTSSQPETMKLPLLFKVVLTIIMSLVIASAQPGKTDEALIDENGQVHPKYEAMSKKLQSLAPIGPVDAVEIAVLMDAAKADPETMAMVARLRSGEKGGGRADLEAFIKDATPIEIVKGMRESVSEIKALDFLFQDPAKAVVEMNNEGLIDKKRLSHYKKHPEDLAADTRKGIYFSFVTLAVAGGFI